MTFITVQLSKLILSSSYQARKTQHTEAFIAELAESILAVGLLQNLVVTKAKKKGFYEVVAGGGRLRALNLLLEAGKLPDHLLTLSVLFVDDATAFLASLTENTVRANMHPADEFLAFQHLAEQGKAVEDIAALFGVTPTVVTRRLKLARVASSLLEKYRDGEMTLECLMAFTINEDHEKQEAAWASLGSSHNRPNHIKHLLTEETFKTDNRLVRLIGLDAYKSAGGTIRQDLFAAEGNDGLYLEDPALVRTLALEHITELGERVRAAEGWAWATTILDDFGELRSFEYVSPTRMPASDEQEEILKKLRARQDDLAHQVDALHIASPMRGELFKELAVAREEFDAVFKALDTWPDQAKALAGIAITVTHNGKAEIHRGLVRAQDLKELRCNEAKGQVDSAVTKPSRAHSEVLTRQLSANKTGIVAVELMQAPHTALAVLAAKLGAEIFNEWGDRDTFYVKISLKDQSDYLRNSAADYNDSQAATEIERHKQHWFDLLPKNEEGKLEPLLPWALTQDTPTLIEFLAFCTALSLDGVLHNDDSSALDAIAQPLSIDVQKWWQPTEASYLSRVSKERIADVVTEAIGAEQATPLLAMKKKDAAKQAAALLADSGWLPKLLTIA